MSPLSPRTPPMTYHYPRASTSSSSPATSVTAVSLFSTPTTDGPASERKLFGLVPMIVTLSDKDDEKDLPGPGPSSRHRRVTSLAGLITSPRRLRLHMSHAISALALISVVAIWYTGLPNLPSSSSWPLGDSSKSIAANEPPTLAVGGSGTYATDSPTTTTPIHHNRPDTTPPTPIQTWGVDLSSDRFIGGLTPWPDNPEHDPEQPPLSTLGHFADNVYNLGSLTLREYSEQLREFVKDAFPRNLHARLNSGLDRYLNPDAPSAKSSWMANKAVWQTDKNKDLVNSHEVKSWREGKAQEEKWKWTLMTDKDADKYVKKMLKGTRMELLWQNLPSGIHRSDTLRYILLLLEGGIYSDTDTNLLRPPSLWGGGAKLFRDGAGWLDDESLKRIEAGEKVEAVLGPPSVIVGVEADVGEREDWFDWWPRPMQIVQWTMASTPDHPIALSALLRILHSTAKAIDWAHDHAHSVKALNDLGRYDDSRKLLETTVMDEPKEGGPIGVMAWTGPGVWTDAVLSYLRVRYGILWTDLRHIRQPLRIGEVVILPVTGFSPGVGNFGSQPAWDSQAMVEHRFRGSWKPAEDAKFYMGETH